jgi:hypothetical protein
MARIRAIFRLLSEHSQFGQVPELGRIWSQTGQAGWTTGSKVRLAHAVQTHAGPVRT